MNIKRLYRFVASIILVAFSLSSLNVSAIAQVAPMPFMPVPGTMVYLSPKYTPAYLKGIVIHPENALKFDFIIYKGDKPLTQSEKMGEYNKLMKYFLASLAIPDEDQWVNLSPYEKDRIIQNDFGKTIMGRDLLAQDYMLKQTTASLIYPEDSLGKEFWAKVYAQARQKYGSTNVPINTFNKVWILPDDALVYEKGNTAFILKNHLKVMLEEDYLALHKHVALADAAGTHSLASKIVKEIVLPELQREVNEDENFATVRQVYSGMLLATWYKRALRRSLLGRIYANKSLVKGVDQDPRTNEMIYQRYLKAYRKGVFNFIESDWDTLTNQEIPRKYFSGGAINSEDKAMKITDQMTGFEADAAQKAFETGKFDDAAMQVEENSIAASIKRFNNSLHNLNPWKVSTVVLAFILALILNGDSHNRNVSSSNQSSFDLGLNSSSAEAKTDTLYSIWYKAHPGVQGPDDEQLRRYMKYLLDPANGRQGHIHSISDWDVWATRFGLPSQGEAVSNIYFGSNPFKDNFRSGAPTVSGNSRNGSIHLRNGSPAMIAELHKARNTDFAQYGGIDFNSANLNLQIKRDGNGVPLPISRQDLKNIHIDGLTPVILEIKPANAAMVFPALAG